MQWINAVTKISNSPNELYTVTNFLKFNYTSFTVLKIHLLWLKMYLFLVEGSFNDNNWIKLQLKNLRFFLTVS